MAQPLLDDALWARPLAESLPLSRTGAAISFSLAAMRLPIVRTAISRCLAIPRANNKLAI
jgi:hypothetical protein